MSYKVMLKGKGGWNPAMDDFGKKPMYFSNKQEAKEYAGSLTNYSTKVMETKKRKTNQGGWDWL